MRYFVWLALAVLLLVGALSWTAPLLNRRFETLDGVDLAADPGAQFVQTRSGRVHLLDLGAVSEERGVILLLHGTGRSVADWQEGLAERLARSHRVIAFDYYGHGFSDRAHAGRYGLALWARQAIDVLDALAIERVTVVGHSAGGAVAAILAADHPERIARAVFIGHGMAMDPAQMVPIVPGIGELQLARTRLFSDVFSTEHERRLARAWSIRGTRAALLTFLRRQYTIDGLRLVLGTYEDIERPVLQVHGDEDLSIPVEAGRQLGARIADARFLAFEGVGHDVHVESPDALARAIAAFVSEAEPRMRRVPARRDAEDP